MDTGPMRGAAALLAPLAAAVLVSCAGAPPAPSQPPATPPLPSSPQPPPVRETAEPTSTLAALAREQRTLARALDGTPAVVVLDDDGALVVELPAAAAFGAGAAAPTPALLALLDRVAASAQRAGAVRLVAHVPTEAGAGVVLADRRAAQLRAQLMRRGVAAARIRTTVASAAWLRLVAEPLPLSPAARPAP